MMAGRTVEVTKELYPHHTTLYKNFFLFRVPISLNETAAVVEVRGGRRLLTWKSAPYVTLAVESCAA